MKEGLQCLRQTTRDVPDGWTKSDWFEKTERVNKKGNYTVDRVYKCKLCPFVKYDKAKDLRTHWDKIHGNPDVRCMSHLQHTIAKAL